MLELIYENPEVDVERLLRSKAAQGDHRASPTLTDKTHYQFFDDERRALQERLEALLPGVRGRASPA